MHATVRHSHKTLTPPFSDAKAYAKVNKYLLLYLPMFSLSQGSTAPT